MEPNKLEAYKTILGFAFKLQKGISLALEDGKFDIGDIVHFQSAFLTAPFLPAALNQVKSGFKDISPGELEILKEFVTKEFDIKNDKLESNIEDGLALAINIFNFVKKAKS